MNTRGLALVAALSMGLGVPACDKSAKGDRGAKPPPSAAPAKAPGPRHSTPEELAKTAVEALKNGDSEALKKLAIAEQDADGIVAAATVPEAMKEKGRQHFESTGKRVQERAGEWLEQTAQRAKKDGVDLAGIEYKTAFYKIKEDDGLLGTSVKVTVVAKGRTYGIRLADCVKAARGWVVIDGVKWRGPTEGAYGDPCRELAKQCEASTGAEQQACQATAKGAEAAACFAALDAWPAKHKDDKKK